MRVTATPPADFPDLWSGDRQRQNRAYSSVLELTDSRVDWAYEVWDDVVRNLTSKDNHDRAIAALVLCNLAKSDPDRRLLQDFAALFAVTRDERFVTARHCMQSLWKVGLAGEAQRARLLSALTDRYMDCVGEKNSTLIRQDILQSLRNLYDVAKDATVKSTALGLIDAEEDLRYRTKYAGVWRSAT